MAGIKGQIGEALWKLAPKIAKGAKGLIKGAKKKILALGLGAGAGNFFSKALDSLTGSAQGGGRTGGRNESTDDDEPDPTDLPDESDEENTDLESRLLNQEKSRLGDQKSKKAQELKKSKKKFRDVNINNERLIKERIQSTELISAAKQRVDSATMAIYNNTDPEMDEKLHAESQKANELYKQQLDLDRKRELGIERNQSRMSELASLVDSLSTDLNSLETQIVSNTNELKNLSKGSDFNFGKMKDFLSEHFGRVKSKFKEVAEGAGDNLDKVLGFATIAMSGFAATGLGSGLADKVMGRDGEADEVDTDKEANSQYQSKQEGSQVGGIVKGAALNATLGALPEIAGKLAAKDGLKIAEKVGVKTAGKFIGKTALKHVPLLGVGIGAKFAYDRFQDGDYLGSALEMASGLSSTLDLVAPGAGLAAGLLIDGVLGGMDAYKEMNKYDASANEKMNIYRDLSEGKTPGYTASHDNTRPESKLWAHTEAKNLGDAIGGGESAKAGGYNAVNMGKKHGYIAKDYSKQKVKLTDRSIGDVIDSGAAGKNKEFNAVGKYQMQSEFIKAYYELAGLSRRDKFNGSNQEKIFNAFLMNNKNTKAYLTKNFRTAQEEQRAKNLAVDAIANKWASVQGSNGRGKYDGDGVNKATVTPKEIIKHLDSMKVSISKNGDETAKQQTNSEETILSKLNVLDEKLNANNTITTETFKQTYNRPPDLNAKVVTQPQQSQSPNH